MALHGKNATLRFSTTVIEASEWSLTRTQETADTTRFTGAGGARAGRRRITGLEDWTGTFITEANNELLGLRSTATFRPSNSAVSTTNPYYNGAVIVTEEAVAVPKDDKVQWSWAFESVDLINKQTST